MKVFQYIMRALMIVSVITIAYLCGIYSAEFSQNQKENKSTIMTIAVVNADTGVMTGGEKRYYASELMLFPDTNFVTASLAEAEEGVAAGNYAAYILIPENFSESIESVNREPVKTQITYALYDDLRQDVEIKTVNDIHNFILNLSTNISYIYVNSILKEVHAVQDDSQTIMQNDVRDREAIEEVQSAELITEVQYEPLEVVGMELEYMDLSPKYETLAQTIFGLDMTYTDAVANAQEEFARVKTDGLLMNEQVGEGAKALAEVDILTDADGNCVYEDGMESLGNAAAEFDGLFYEKRMTAKQRLGFQEGDEEPEPEPEPDPELPEEEKKVYITKYDLLKRVNAQIDYLKETAEDQTASVDEKKVIGELETLKAEIDEYYLNAIRAINAIPAPSEITSFTQQIINDEIAPPLADEIAREAENVASALNGMLESIDGYVETIDEYDAMSYLDTQAIMDYQDVLHDTVYDMETEIMEQDAQYLAYIDEVERVAQSNTEMLQESLDASYEQTTETIGEVMAGFQENRETLNELNVSLLDGITKKLPYTRLGTLEYAQVYDFIVRPVVSDDVSDHKVETDPASVYLGRTDLIRLGVGAAALVTLYVSVLLIHRKWIHAKEKGEEGEQWQTE
ncbi:MAG: hypothetical protein NC302_04930 [Bacteroidales bacterium]|nr:hypothetical protein [Bacteroidales bacterium]MCM1416366.1 hypothetical protein [bacterium]MCM1422641.1 hypothetical protein [bacterium]